MNIFIERLMMVFFGCAMIVIAVVFISLPFAFLGWIMLLAVNIFTVIDITYTASTVLGITAVFISGMLSSS